MGTQPLVTSSPTLFLALASDTLITLLAASKRIRHFLFNKVTFYYLNITLKDVKPLLRSANTLFTPIEAEENHGSKVLSQNPRILRGWFQIFFNFLSGLKSIMNLTKSMHILFCNLVNIHTPNVILIHTR